MAEYAIGRSLTVESNKSRTPRDLVAYKAKQRIEQGEQTGSNYCAAGLPPLFTQICVCA